MKLTTAGRVVILLGVAVALVAVFRGVDWRATGACLAHLRGAAPLLLLPYALEVSLDAWAWRFTFERCARVAWAGLLTIRVASEALANSLPAGVAVAETVRALLLKERFGLPVSHAAANLLISKLTMALGQAVFVLVGVTVAAPTLRDHSQRLIGGAGLHYIGVGTALGFLLLMALVLMLVGRGRILGQLHAAAHRSSGPRSRLWLAKLEGPVRDLDHGLGAAKRLPRWQLALSVGVSFCAWSALALETWTILRLLTPGVSYAQAFSIEAVLSVVRVLFFFVPGGFGAQEATYFALISITGVPNAEVVAVAFIIAKRAKELVWIGGGYLTLWRLRVRNAASKQSAVAASLQT